MESINTLKGYGKVNPDDQKTTTTTTITHHHRPPRIFQRKPLIITVTISALLLLTLLVGLMLTVLIHKSKTEPSSSSSSTPSTNAASIEKVCKFTQYPTTCSSTISSSSINSSKNPDPELIFKFSLLVSINEVKNFTFLLKTLNEANSQAAIDDCISQFDDALARLNDSVSAMAVKPGEKLLTAEKAIDIQTWVSSAMTDQDTCIEGLEEMGSSLVDEVKKKMETSKQCLSNSLAIIAKMPDILASFGLKM